MKKEKKEGKKKKGKEVIIAWNSPKIQHADGSIKDTIDKMHSAVKWHCAWLCSFKTLILSHLRGYLSNKKDIDKYTKKKQKTKQINSSLIYH